MKKRRQKRKRKGGLMRNRPESPPAPHLPRSLHALHSTVPLVSGTSGCEREGRTHQGLFDGLDPLLLLGGVLGEEDPGVGRDGDLEEGRAGVGVGVQAHRLEWYRLLPI